MKTLSIDNYSFIIVNEAPNIILTTKIGKDFSALNNNEKEIFLKKNFGIKDLIIINQKHSEKIKGINTEGNDCDGFHLKENGIGCLVIMPITGDNEIMATLHRAITSTTGAIFVLVARRLSPW